MSSMTPPMFGNQSETGIPDLPYAFERSQTRNDGPLHLRVVIAESNRIHDFAGVFIVLRIEGVDVAHATAHEQIDDRFRVGLSRQTRSGILPSSAHSDP